MFSWHPLQASFGGGPIHNASEDFHFLVHMCIGRDADWGLVSLKPLPEEVAASVPGYQPFNATTFSAHLEESVWKTEGGAS